MTDWLPVLARLCASGTPGVLVTVAATRGSVPREAGTKMVVTEDATFGTIGGGQLEYEALRTARAMLTGGVARAAVPVRSGTVPRAVLRRHGRGSVRADVRGRPTG